MKNIKIVNFVGLCSMLVLGSVALAQDNGGAASSGGTTSTGGTTSSGSTTGMQTDVTGTRQQRNDDTDYGWLGLLGLAGFAGLMKKPRQEVVHQTDVPRTTVAAGPANR